MNNTFFQTTADAAAKAKWYQVDAAGKTLGRLASEVAVLLRGKNKPTFTPHVDGGDFVIVTNASKIVLTGDKLKKKKYFKHTGYIGGIKEKSAGDFLQKDPVEMIKQAVGGMLPKGPLGRDILKKLKVFAGNEHTHAAQSPETFTLAYHK